MTHDENRISDLIDGGIHDKSAIDRGKYKLHMRQKAAIEEAAEKARIDNIVCLTGKAKEAFRMGAKEVIEHPERYGLTSLRLDETWPLKDVLTKLVDAADTLLIKYDYDQTYWEQIQVANKEAKKILEELK